MVRGTARNENYSAAAADCGNVGAQTAERDTLIGNVQTTTHGVDNRLGLLENLLLHKVVELALHDLLQLKLQGLDSAHGRCTVPSTSTVDVELALVDVSNVVILKVEHLFGVLHNGGGVRRQEELGGHRHAIVRQESTRLRSVEQRLVGGSKRRTSLQVLEGHVVSSLLSGERARVRELDIDKVHLHLARSLDTDDKGGTLARGDNLMGVVHRLEEKTESTLKL